MLNRNGWWNSEVIGVMSDKSFWMWCWQKSCSLMVCTWTWHFPANSELKIITLMENYFMSWWRTVIHHQNQTHCSAIVRILDYCSVMCHSFSLVVGNTLKSKHDPKVLKQAFVSDFTQKIFCFYCNQKSQAFGWVLWFSMAVALRVVLLFHYQLCNLEC